MKKGIVGILSAIGGAATGITVIKKRMDERIMEKQTLSDKHLDLFLMMNQWVKVKQNGKNLSSYFEQEGYKKIAIYGMHYAGETLVEELMGSNIEVMYGIDKNAKKIFADFDVVTPDSALDKVDAIVVSSITFFDEIKDMLSDKVDCPIISLEDILYQL